MTSFAPKSSDGPSWSELAEAWTPRQRPTDLLRGSFPAQRRFVEDDTSRFLYAFCTRRAAKSYSGGLKAFRRALKSRCNVLIAGLDHKEVKRIWWRPIIFDIIERFGVEGCHTNETELTVRLPNGSIIYLLGMDADESQRKKALGQKFALVLIDEAQDWSTDLETTVFHVLKPAVADYNGQIALLGTPGLVTRGLFYDVTTGKETGWTLHEWTTHDNTTRPEGPSHPSCAERWATEIADLKKMKPGVERTPWFQRNYERKWVVDTEALVYRYQAGRNDFLELPFYRRGEWHHVLGCDLGWNATALGVHAYHDHDPNFYTLRSYRRQGLDLTGVAEQAKALDRVYQFERWMIDGAAKQSVEEMKRRQDCPWVPADKIGKADFIELHNTEMLLGRVLHRANGDCADLIGEQQALIWDQKLLREKGKKEEKQGLPNHCCDETLYAWRECYPYLSTIHPPEALVPGSESWRAKQEERVTAESAKLEAEFLAEGERMQRQRREEEEEESWR